MISFMKTNTRFQVLALGLVLLGLGHTLGIQFVLSPLASDRAISIFWGLFSLALLVLGTVFLYPVVSHIVRYSKSDRRFYRTLLVYMLGSVALGLLLGLLGQWVYNVSSFSYDLVKTGLWVATSYGQLVLKMVTLYSLIKIYYGQVIRFNDMIWWYVLGVVLLITTLGLGTGALMPSLGNVIVPLVEFMTLLLSIAYFCDRTLKKGENL